MPTALPKRRPRTMHLEREGVDRDGRALYRCTSQSRATGYYPTIDLCSGLVWCDCPDFTCRRAPDCTREGTRNDIGNMRCLCKHLHLAVADCIRRGEILVTLEEITPECEEFHLWTASTKP